MKTNFKKLLATKHMLNWLSNHPFDEIIATLSQLFIQQSASTKMLDFEITSEPEWLTGAKKTADKTKIIVVRCGLAVACHFTLQDNNGTYNLNGILTWVGVNLDENPKTNMWMDLDGTLAHFGKNGLLNERIYELENIA